MHLLYKSGFTFLKTFLKGGMGASTARGEGLHFFLVLLQEAFPTLPLHRIRTSRHHLGKVSARMGGQTVIWAKGSKLRGTKCFEKSCCKTAIDIAALSPTEDNIWGIANPIIMGKGSQKACWLEQLRMSSRSSVNGAGISSMSFVVGQTSVLQSCDLGQVI